MTPTATIKNAARIKLGALDAIEGNVYGDTRGRFKDGKLIITSNIVRVEGDLVFTRNSVYRVEWAS